MYGKQTQRKNKNILQQILLRYLILSLSLVACQNQPTPLDSSNAPTSLPTEASPDTPVVSPTPSREQDHTWKASPILVRLERIAGYTSYEYAWSLTPDLILYADGTLMGTNWQFSGANDIATVWQAHLSNSEMCGVLYTLENLGYFDYSVNEYETPQVTDLSDTTLSVQAWRDNLINVYALSWYIANLDASQTSPLADAYQYLSSLQPENVTEYRPDRLALLVSETQQNATEVAAPLWPYEEIKLAEVMTGADDYQQAETFVEGTQAKDIYDHFAGYWSQTFVENDKMYQVTIRPIFPLEIYEKVEGWGSLATFEPGTERQITCNYDEREDVKTSSPESAAGSYEEVDLHWITSFGLRNAPDQIDDADLIAISPNDHLWLVNHTNARLEELTLSGERLGYLPVPKSWITDLDFLPDGRMAFLDQESYSIQILDGSGQVIETIENLPYLNENDQASLFAMGPDGQIILGFARETSILIFDPSSHQVETWFGPEDDPINDVTDLDVDQQGNIYVADFRENHILRRTSDGQIQVILSDAPRHIIILPDSSFYTVGNHFISYYAPDRTPLKKWSDQDLDIVDVALASDGSLLVLNDKFWADGPAIVRFDRQGHELASFGNAPLQPGQFDSHNAFSVSALGDVWVMATGA